MSTPPINTQLTPVPGYLNRVSSLLTPSVYAYTVSSNLASNLVNTAISINFDISSGTRNNAIQFYNETSGNNNGIEISDSYSNSIIGNLNGTDLDFSANNLFNFRSSQGISVNNNISCNDISCNDISCNQITNTGNITINPSNNLIVLGDINMSSNNITNVGSIEIDNGTNNAILSIDGSGNLLIDPSLNLTIGSGSSLTLQPTNNLSTTNVPYGLFINSPLTKTYPTPASSQSYYPAYYTNLELGTSQTIDASLNFVYGDYRNYTKSAGTTSDIERLYFNGFSQSFNWTDANTCKQYIGFSDTFNYSGKDANGRISSSLNADSVFLTCPTLSSQTISNVSATNRIRITATNSDCSYNITNISSPNINFGGSATNVIATITNHTFLQNSSIWDANWTGSGSMATITNMYGLRLHPPNGGTTTGLTITNNWGVYQEWGLSKNYFAGNVGIGIATNNSSAKLQVDSTTQGFLPPRMTGVQANAIATPAEGLMVYITDAITAPFLSKGWWGYNGATWTQLG